MHTLVALDLETTGLDPQLDAIIEIGAVRFQGNRVDREWSTLINPGRPLPPFITQLTGIDDSMLASAPRMREVAEQLHEFVGEEPILGHQVEFDLSFLRRRGLFADNPALDTYDLASVVLPDADRYSLASLAAALGVPVRTSHRALEDARATMQVYQRLFARLLELPPELVQQLAGLAPELDWSGGWILEDALDQLVESGVSLPRIELRPWSEFPPAGPESPALKPSDERRPLDVEELAAVLEPGGAMAQAFPGYEHRSQQVRMLRAVATALSESQHLLVEAGTGTGKSIAYLVPAFAWAQTNGERVLVSTNTLNLQDQLIYKDVPDLQRALGQECRAAVLKGRGNYLCPRRFSALRRLGARTVEEARVLAKVMVWLHQGGSGDVGEITLRGPAEGAVWSRLASDASECSLEACMLHTGGVCPYYRARRAAESAHVVIVNHALLLADITTGSRVIPDYKHLIVDEAHHLESATTRGLSFQMSEGELLRMLRDLGGPEAGLLGRLVRLAQRELQPEEFGRVRAAALDLSEQASACLERAPALFASLSGFLERRREGKPLGRYGQQERVVPSTRTLPEWSETEIAWEALREPMGVVSSGLGQLAESVQNLADDGLEAAEDLAFALRSTGRSITEIVASLDETIFEADAQRIYWLQLQGEPPRLSVHAAPLAVGPLVEKYLWHEKEAVIMTSATLATAGEFDYLRHRLNADEADELLLGSPFDFESSTLLYLINDIPEPVEGRAYQRQVERGLVALCTATHGRTLVLFTSNEQLLTTAREISPLLNAKGIQVLTQSAGASRHALLESFKSSEGAVLLGTRSFWEGVDVPGAALSVLAIVRLPFDVPSDPIIAARSETFEDPFREYSLPEAILRFRQGFGRLIRTRSDRGVVVSFDRRLLSKPYGQTFLASLPGCTRRIGPLASLPREAARWLNL
jgi:DNA polymerase-3 subunit epsilon/ATP-dependent DNA helicase DinG